MTEFPSLASHADVVVVGSGPVGAVYARLVADAVPSARILVVDSGPALTAPPGAHLTTIDDAAARDRAEIAAQGPDRNRRTVRATSGIAHDLPHDRRDRAFLLRPGLYPVDPSGSFPAAQSTSMVGGMGSQWFAACPRPGGSERIGFLDPDRLDAALAVAERLLRVSADQFADAPAESWIRTRLGSELDAGRAADRRVQPMPMALTVTGGTVRRFGADAVLGGRVAVVPECLCIEVLTDDRDRGVAGVRLRSLRTGRITTVRTTQLVLAADPLRTPQLMFASGIRPAALGRHLNEHAQVSVAADLHGYPGQMPTGPARGVTWIPFDDDSFPFHGMVTPLDADGRRAAVHLYLPQDVTAANRVTFDEAVPDWTGLPSIRLHHEPGPRDRAVVRAASAAALAVGGMLGRTAEAPWVHPAGSSLHYQGTLRMGPADDGTSVCGPGSAVWGVPGLRVAGNGVIPTRTACNPTLTSMALAVLGAQDLITQLTGPARRESAHLA